MAQLLDDFTGTTGALLRQRPGWTYVGPAAQQDRATISNNRVKVGGTSGSGLHYGYLVNAGDAAHFVQAKFLRATGTGSCLYLRWTDANNFIAIRNSGANLEAIRRIRPPSSACVVDTL